MPRHATRTSFVKNDLRLIGNKFSVGTSWNRGKHPGIHPKTEFKKGHIPWWLENGYDPRNTPNWKGFRITKHKGNFYRTFKKILLIDIGKCEMCGNKDKRVLQLHHKDLNPYNNLRENLQLLCANCHLIIHNGEVRGD